MLARRVFLLLGLLWWLVGCSPPVAAPGQSTLTIAYPAVVQVGGVDEITLTFILQNEALEPVFETHNVLAEARLELPGVQIQPFNTVSETLQPGQQALFFWSMRPERVGTFEGQVWFYLRFVPKAGGPETRQALSAQKVSVEVDSFFGLDAPTARWLGALGLAFSAGLGAPLWVAGWKRMLLRLGKRS